MERLPHSIGAWFPSDREIDITKEKKKRGKMTKA